MLNPVRALLATHDKLRDALTLSRAGLPHPRTTLLRAGSGSPVPRAPIVLKPRFGSWGKDVRLCLTDSDVRHALADFAGRRWFRRHGVLVQGSSRQPVSTCG